MAVSPALAEDLAREVRDLYQAAEHQLLTLIARALAADLNSPRWAELRLRAVGDLLEAVDRVATALQLDTTGAVHRALTDAYDRGRHAAIVEIGALDIGRELVAREVLPNAASVDRLAASLAADTRPLYARITRSVRDIYQRTVARASAGELVAAQTRRQAAQYVLDQMAARGITGFVDRAGRGWDMASYAEMAVRSVTARAAVDGHVDYIEQLGLDLVVVSDAPLECPLCEPWEGKILSLQGPPGSRVERHRSAVSAGLLRRRPMVDVRVAGTLLEARSEGLFHPNCFPGDVLVSAPSGVRAADSRWYEGDLVVIKTASGDEVPVTPNHPILTPEGWVAAGTLQVGQSVLRHRGHVEPMDSVSPDDEQVPALISEVFDALRQASTVPPIRVPASAEHFHGDGAGSDVKVVLADCLLADGLDSEVVEVSRERQLLLGGVGPGALLAASPAFQVVGSASHAAHGLVCARHLGGPLIGGHASPLTGLGFAAADGGPALGDPTADAGLADGEGGRELALALASSVAADHVVYLGRRQFSGHVYNLQTGDGWYVAGGLVVHNCRHSLAAYLPGVTAPPQPVPHPLGTTYEDTQRQRLLERRVREWKRRAAIALDDTAHTRANAQVRAYQAKLREHTAATGLRRDYTREQIHSAR